MCTQYTLERVSNESRVSNKSGAAVQQKLYYSSTQLHISETSILDISKWPHDSKRCLSWYVAEWNQTDVGCIRVLNATPKLIHDVPQRLSCISSLSNIRPFLNTWQQNNPRHRNLLQSRNNYTTRWKIKYTKHKHAAHINDIICRLKWFRFSTGINKNLAKRTICDNFLKINSSNSTHQWHYLSPEMI